MKVKGNITFGRNSSHEITIKLQDEASGITFAVARLDSNQLADMLFGRAFVDVDLEVRGLENVGKTKVVEARHLEYPGHIFDSRETMEEWLQQNAQEEGWHLSPRLGSQTSVGRKDGKAVLNYHVFRFEGPP